MAVISVGIATADGVSVCDHLARCAGVVVFGIQDGAVVSRAARSRADEACGNHRTFTELLEGCSTVICGGIGQGAVNSLAAAGVRTMVLAKKGMTVEEAAAGYVAGTLATTDERVCLCG
jgi:predicted Fe-Mo cluster-binding NifX family protein